MEEAINWFQSFLINSVDAFLEFDQQQRCLCVNPIAANLIGLDSQVIIGKTSQDILKFYPQNSQITCFFSQILTGLQSVFDRGETGKASYRLKNQEGDEKVYEFVYTPVKEASDTIARVICVGRDITDYYTQVDSPQITEENLSYIVEKEQAILTNLTADIGLALRRHPQDILVPCCHAIIQHLPAFFAQLWIVSHEESLELQATAGSYIPQEILVDRIDIGAGIIGLIAQEKQARFDANNAIEPWGLLKKDVELPKHLEKISFAGYPLIVEEQIRGVMVILTEEPLSDFLHEKLPEIGQVIAVGIERKSAETELSTAKTFFNSIMENLPVGVFTKDAESLRFILWNRAGEAITGITKQEILGKNEYAFFTKEQADLLTAHEREFLKQFEKEHKPSQEIIEESVNTPHKGLRILHTRKIPILDIKGYPKYLLGITEDITERRQIDESVRLYDQIVENMQIGLYVYQLQDINDDHSLRIISSNPAASLFTGLEMADVLGMALDDIFPEQREKGIPQAFASVVLQQKAIELEDIDYDDKGQVTRAFCIKAFPLPNNCVGVAFENITDRKQLEVDLQRALQQTEHSEKLMRTVIDATPDLIVAKDCDFRYILANQSFAKAIGKSVSEILGKDDIELGFSEDIVWGNNTRNIKGFRSNDRAALEGKIVRNSRVSFTFADRTQHIFDIQNIPLKDPEGNIFASLAVSHDITERHKSDVIQTQLISSLQENEERYRSLVANIPGVVYRGLCDDKFTIIFMSEFAVNLTGYPLSHFLGNEESSFSRIIHPEDFPKVQKIMRKAAENQECYQIQYRINVADGSWKWVWEQGCPFYSEDSKILYLDGVIFDVTPQKQAQEELTEKNRELENAFQQLKMTQMQLIQAEKMSSLGQLVAGIAHEINNPVNFINGNIAPANEYAQELLELCNLYDESYPEPTGEIQDFKEEIEIEFLKEDFPQLLTSIQMGADRIREIVQSLRNFSRLGEADLKPVDIHQGIDSTLLILHHRLKEAAKVCAIEIIKDYGTLPLVECYPGLLNQALMNIISNGIDALEENFLEMREADEKFNKNSKNWKKPIITISTKLLGEDRVVISISDNGAGMTTETLSQVFDPFFTTKSVGKGTGLGLSISYQIIAEKHQGVLRCNSEPGKGSQFLIEIPIYQQSESPES